MNVFFSLNSSDNIKQKLIQKEIESHFLSFDYIFSKRISRLLRELHALHPLFLVCVSTFLYFVKNYYDYTQNTVVYILVGTRYKISWRYDSHLDNYC